MFRPWYPLIAGTCRTHSHKHTTCVNQITSGCPTPQLANFQGTACQTASSNKQHTAALSASCLQRTSSASPSQLLSSGQSVEGEVLLVSSLVSSCCCNMPHTLTQTHNVRQPNHKRLLNPSAGQLSRQSMPNRKQHKTHTAALSASCLQRTSSASPSQLFSSEQSVEGEVLIVSSLVSSYCCQMPHTFTQTHNMRQPNHKRLPNPSAGQLSRHSMPNRKQQKTTYSRIVSIMSAKDIFSQPVATALIRAVSGRRSIACFIPGILLLLPHAAQIDTNTQHASTKSQAAAQHLSWPTFKAQHAKPHAAKNNIQPHCQHHVCKGHPQPARRNCSHQGSQWKEKYCLFHPWYPLVAATCRTHSHKHTTCVNQITSGCPTPQLANFQGTACHTASSKKQHTAALSASCLQRTSSASPSQLPSSGQSVEGEVLLVSSLVSSYCCHMPHKLTHTHTTCVNQITSGCPTPQLANFQGTACQPQAAKNNIQPHCQHHVCKGHPQPARRNCSHQGSQWKEKYCLFHPWYPLVAATCRTHSHKHTTCVNQITSGCPTPQLANFQGTACHTASSKKQHTAALSASCLQRTSSASPSQLLSSGQSVEGEVLLVSSLVSSCCCHMPHTLTHASTKSQSAAQPLSWPTFKAQHAEPQAAKNNIQPHCQHHVCKGHPQPARRNCSHQGSQWKEKYCLFHPWYPLVAATCRTHSHKHTTCVNQITSGCPTPQLANFQGTACQTASSQKQHTAALRASCLQRTSSASPSQLLSSEQSVEGEVLLVSSLVSSCCCHMPHTFTQTHNMRQPNHKRLPNPSAGQLSRHSMPHRKQQKTTYSRIVSIMSAKDIFSQPVATALIRAVSGRRSIACFIPGILLLLPHAAQIDTNTQHASTKSQAAAQHLSWPTFKAQHAKPHAAKNNIQPHCQHHVCKGHPQPARRNCSHQGSQWKEKYCLFHPWYPLVAGTCRTH